MAQADSYSEQIPRPEQILGQQVGESHAEPHQIVEYFREVAQASDRVTWQKYAQSHERRPLIYAVVTSPANHARIDEILQANRQLSESPDDVSAEQLAQLPVIVYQGFSVHGDEPSTSEAALLLLYHLAAGEGAKINEILNNVVLLIDPVLNPDGRQRFATWVNQNRGHTPVSDPANREHRQPWPGGRTNHYWFDLNRDLLPARHPETMGRVKLLHHWRPQIVTDYHEMGSDWHYYFQPGSPIRVNRNIPEANQKLTALLGERHAKALDGIGSLYFTGETFDDFNPAKGSTYPDVIGSIGILFEQASARALIRETENGLLTYTFTIRNQFSTSLSTLQGALELREELLRYQRDFFAEAPELAERSEVQSYLISLEGDRTRAQELIRLLLAHEIHVHALREPVQVEGQTFRPESAVVIPRKQPFVRLLTTMMERQLEFEDDQFYDISTWTLPLAFGVKWAEWNKVPSLGPRLTELELDGGRLIGGQADYAYLIPWERYFTPRALHRWQRAGIQARLLTRPLSIPVEDREWKLPAGTLLVPVNQQDLGGVPADVIHEAMQTAVQQDHLRIFAVNTGLTEQGPDLGTRRSAQLLQRPEIALVTGEGTTSYNAGEVWHLLSERFEIPVSLVDADNLRASNLSRYNTLVLAGGSYGKLSAEAVQEWVRGGGRLIAVGSGADWAISENLLDLKSRTFNLDKVVGDRPFAELADARGAHQIGGVIFEVELDTTHPLAFGYGKRATVFRNHSRFYDVPSKAGLTVGKYAENPLVSGYISAERLEQAPGAAAVVASRVGSGKVVLIMDNPNFRAFWYGTNGLFLNSIFLSDAI